MSDPQNLTPNGLSYKHVGVDIDAGNALVEAIKPAVRSTRRSGADAEIGAGASAVAVGAAGGKSKAKRETLNEAGDAGACEKASAGDTTPPFGCGALLRIEVVPLGGAKTAAPTCAAGTVWDGHQCARAAAPTPTPALSAPPPALPGGAPIVCLLGTHWAGSRCVPDPVQACGDKQYYEPGKGCQPDYPGCPHGSHYGGTDQVCALNYGQTPDDLYRRAEAARRALPIYGHRDYCRLLTAHFANDRHVADCMYFDAVEYLTRGNPLDAEGTLRRSLAWPDGDHAPEVLLSLIQLHEQPDFKRRGPSDVSDLVSRLRTRYPQSAAAKAIAGQ